MAGIGDRDSGDTPVLIVLGRNHEPSSGKAADLAEQVMDRFPSVGVVLLSGYTAATVNLDRLARRGTTFASKL